MRLLEIDTLPTIPLHRDRATRAVYRINDPDVPPAERLIQTTLRYAGPGTCYSCGRAREVWAWDRATSPFMDDAAECPPCLTEWGTGTTDGWVWAAPLMAPAMRLPRD